MLFRSEGERKSEGGKDLRERELKREERQMKARERKREEKNNGIESTAVFVVVGNFELIKGNLNSTDH